MTLFTPRANLILSVLLLVVLFTSLIVIAIDGDLVRRAGGDAGGVWAFNIFLPIWTWLSIVPLLVFATRRLDFVLLQTRFVIANIALLWVFWLAAAAATTDSINGFLSYCGSGRRSFYFGYYAADCSKYRALLAFLWITWLVITAIFGGLVATAFRESSSKGKDVWSTSVYEHAHLSSGAHGVEKTGSAAPPVESKMANANANAQTISQPSATVPTPPSVNVTAPAPTSAV